MVIQKRYSLNKIGVIIIFIICTILLSCILTIEIYAGRWRRKSNKWWYDNGNGTWPAKTWRWIDGNQDGIAECYYFNESGYMLTSTITPDGYRVNGNGAWEENGVVQTKKVHTIDGTVVPVTSGELDLLAAIIECEAVGEPYDCQVAVGAVIVNRIESSLFPNTITEVIYQKKQFSPVASGKLGRVLARGAKEKCYEAAKEALKGKDITDGCLFFRVDDGREGLVLGKTVFYKTYQ